MFLRSQGNPPPTIQDSCIPFYFTSTGDQGSGWVYTPRLTLIGKIRESPPLCTPRPAVGSTDLYKVNFGPGGSWAVKKGKNARDCLFASHQRSARQWRQDRVVSPVLILRFCKGSPCSSLPVLLMIRQASWRVSKKTATKEIARVSCFAPPLSKSCNPRSGARNGHAPDPP